MDGLSDVLARVRISGSLFSRARLTPPFAVRTNGEASSAVFHVVTAGRVRVRRDGALDSTTLHAGDVVVFPAGSGHVIADRDGRAPVPIASLPAVRAVGGEGGLTIVHNGPIGPGAADVLCGRFGFDAEAARFLQPALPPEIVARGASRPELVAALVALAGEAGAGASALSDRLAEILFVQVVRAWLTSEQVATSGWVAALADPPLARAIRAMTAAPEHNWTASALAQRAGMSRSSFYERFTDRVGETPQAWLTRWRMVLARAALRTEATPVDAIAARVGYQSVAAFTRAFRREAQTTPARFRQAATG